MRYLQEIVIFLITAGLGGTFSLSTGIAWLNTDFGCGIAAIAAYIIWRLINGFIVESGGWGELHFGTMLQNFTAMFIGGFLGCMVGGFFGGFLPFAGAIGGGIGAVLAFDSYVL